MAASKGPGVAGGEDKAAFWDAIGGIQGRLEEVAAIIAEVAEEGRVVAVVCAEAGAEAGVGGEAAPAPGDGAGAGKGGGIRREAEENLREKVVVFQRRRRRREAGRAHAGCDVVDLEGTQGRRITFFF
jgi:hypothetical protein